MDEDIRLWIDKELKQYTVILQEFNQALPKKLYVFMAFNMIGMTAFGFFTSGDITTALGRYLSIACIVDYVWMFLASKGFITEKSEDSL